MPLVHVLLFLQAAAQSSATVAIRINQLGYLPDAPKVAVLCSVAPIEVRDFVVTDAAGKTVLQRPAALAKPFGPCVVNYRLDFSSITKPGEYHIVAGVHDGLEQRIVARALFAHVIEQRVGCSGIGAYSNANDR